MTEPPDDFRIVIDLDSTLCEAKPPGGSYLDCQPRAEVVARLRSLRASGAYVIVHSARQMRTYRGNVGALNAHTLPVILDWLRRYDVPYDEVYVGKPWCGFNGFYVDDRAIRPSEFVELSDSEIAELLAREQA